MTESSGSIDPSAEAAGVAARSKPADDTASSEAAPSQRLAAEMDAALERERWLRAQYEREHQVSLSVMRVLLGNVHDESRLMRFWRWLIDDIRSEKRELDELYRTSGRVDLELRRNGRG